MKETKGNLLIVDDELEIINELKELLANQADQIFSATDGAEALDILDEERIDCIVSDIRMPDMDGVEFLKELYELKKHRPFIFFTAYGSSTLEESLKDYGCYAMVDKPDIDDLSTIVERGLYFGRLFNDSDQFSSNDFDEFLESLEKAESLKKSVS